MRPSGARRGPGWASTANARRGEIRSRAGRAVAGTGTKKTSTSTPTTASVKLTANTVS